MAPRKKCSFCGRSENEVGRLIAGPAVNICEQCVFLCDQMIRGENEGEETVPDEEVLLSVPRPAEIKAFLDLHVVGQDYAKKVLSVAVHNHYKRIGNPGGLNPSGGDNWEDVEIEKSNILLIGPTGSGKTLLAKTLARMLDVPFAVADATTLTEAGYVGEDVENILLHLLRAADMNVKRAEKGIIYIDEIDKIGRKTENVSITRDVSGEGVQQALLKIIEGNVARIPPQGGRKHPQQQYIELCTDNILFVCAGAFVGLESIISRRTGKRTVGFLESKAGYGGNPFLAGPGLQVEPEDLIHYGLIPEFVGRLPVVATMKELLEDDLVRILTEPRNAMVRQYCKLLAMDGLDLSFTDGALREMARIAVERHTGARALRSIMERLMLDVMFDSDTLAPKGSLRVTKTMVDEKMNEFQPSVGEDSMRDTA